jgi:hypothetical protein
MLFLWVTRPRIGRADQPLDAQPLARPHAEITHPDKIAGGKGQHKRKCPLPVANETTRAQAANRVGPAKAFFIRLRNLMLI